MKTVKFKGAKPENNILKAIIPANVVGAKKISFPHRYLLSVDTGVEVEVQAGFKLCFALCPHLSKKGMVITNAPGNIKAGKVIVNLLNCGKEIVELNDGDPLITVWLDEDHKFNWEPK